MAPIGVAGLLGYNVAMDSWISPSPLDGATGSPCVSKCALGAGDHCLGCGRSLQDIVGWSAMGEDGRRRVARESKARMQWTQRDGRVKAVMAIGPLGEAGLGRALPWKLPSELAWFKQATAGKCAVMGRSTWESLPSALPGRSVAVIGSVEPEGLASLGERGFWAKDFDQAMDFCFHRGIDACVVGGPTLISSCWDRIDAIFLTQVAVAKPMVADHHFKPDLSGFKRSASGPSGAEGDLSWSASLWERSP